MELSQNSGIRMADWKTVRLGDVVEILDSKRIPVTSSKRKKGIFPYYGANGIQDYVDGYIFDDELVLLAEDGGNFGSKEKPIAYRVSGKCWVNNHAHVLKPKDILNVDYLCDSLMFYDVSTIVNGATRKKLTQSAMIEMKIPLPPLETQKQIAATLDKVTKIIEENKQLLTKYDLLIKSRFIEMFGDPVSNPMGWNKIELGKACKEVRYGTSKPAIKNGKYTYLRMNNITYEGELDLTNIKTIDISDDELEKCSVKEGDILFNRTNSIDLCGKTCLFKLHETMVIAGYIIRVRVNEKLNPQYVATFFNTKSIKKMLREMAKGAVNQANINAQELQAIKIPLPPIEQQNEFAAFVQQIDKSEFTVQQSLEKAETLYKSLMQEYFG